MTVVWGALFGCVTSLSHAALSNIELLSLNQVGYLTKAVKVAVYQRESKEPVEWVLYDMDSVKEVMSGKTQFHGYDASSDRFVHTIDFTQREKPGKYALKVQYALSYTFEIRDDLYQPLYKDAMAYYYFHRLGVPLKEKYLADARHARPALHVKDERVPCWKAWCGTETHINVANAWADAGDFGLYPVNHAISVWTLLNAYEFTPEGHSDGQLNIPESTNGIPDILDEVRFGSVFLGGMLIPGQLASHKVTSEKWSQFPLNLEEENQLQRYAQPPSTAATLAVARSAAHLARVFKRWDSAYAKAQWQLAKQAWARAVAFPVRYYSYDVDDAPGGGDYSDDHILDDFYVAAVEMWISATVFNDRDKATYAERVRASSFFARLNYHESQNWKEVEGTGSLSLFLFQNTLSLTRKERNILKRNILRAADNILKSQEASIYRTPYNPNFDKKASDKKDPWEWGSNSFVANNMIVLGYAHRITKNRRYLSHFYQAWDYLLGNNALSLSFVTGYGEFSERDTHDRLAYTAYLKGAPFPKGWLSGGPMNDTASCHREVSTDLSLPPALAYGRPGSATTAWCSKENTINWNAPLVWIAAFSNDWQL